VSVDRVIRDLFAKTFAVTGIDSRQIGFEPPDDAWRSYVDTLDPKIGLNCYLVDLRENRSRRSNEMGRQRQNGMVSEIPFPRWIDCHYLITAWDRSTMAIEKGLEPTLVEHDLLYSVTASLMKLDAITPHQVYSPGPLPNDFPPALADVELPVAVLPPDGFPKLAEFWGTMGTGYRWKPAVYLVVTLPVFLDEGLIHSMVATLMLKSGQTRQKLTEEVVTIGGRVLDAQHPLPDGNPAPLRDVEVCLETSDGELLQKGRTDDQGSFTLAGLQEGSFRLHVHTPGLGEKARMVEVRVGPPGAGFNSYDLLF
jgi:hypothetical protein